MFSANGLRRLMMRHARFGSCLLSASRGCAPLSRVAVMIGGWLNYFQKFASATYGAGPDAAGDGFPPLLKKQKITLPER